MQQIYFLLPNLKSTIKLVHELQDIGVEERFIHIVGKNIKRLEKHKLNPAGFLETTQYRSYLESGALIGAVVGILICLAVNYNPPADVILNGVGILTLIGIGAILGAWANSNLGIDTPNPTVKLFEREVARGEYLMIIDAHEGLLDQVTSIIKSYHPEGKFSQLYILRK